MEPRHRGAPRSTCRSRTPTSTSSAWLERDGRELIGELDRLYVPRNDARWLRRNAAVALGNVGGREHVEVLERTAAGEDELVAEHASWALARIAERNA